MRNAGLRCGGNTTTHKVGCVPPRKIDESRAAPALSGPSQPSPTNSHDTQWFKEEPSDSSSTVTEWSSSRVFETDDGMKYELSKEEVTAYLVPKNNDE